jgi:hypothetical protein
VFAWLMSPLAGLSPPLAFALFTAGNVMAALVLAWRVASFLPRERGLLVAGLLLISTPVALSIWFGQVQLLLAIAFGEAFIRFTRRHDLRAGLWLAVLVLKPQYLLLIVPILLWKERWRALAGFALGGAAILGVSIVVAGPQSIAAYIASLVESGSASGGALLVAVAPEVMVNWRGMLLAVPGLPDVARLAITLALSALTVAAVVIAFRGPWRPTGPRFAGQMTLLATGTVLAAYHSHVHGATLIAVPLAALLASWRPSQPIGQMLRSALSAVLAFAVIAPWLWFAVLGRGHERANNMLAVALAAGFLLIFVALRRSAIDDDQVVAQDLRTEWQPARV